MWQPVYSTKNAVLTDSSGATAPTTLTAGQSYALSAPDRGAAGPMHLVVVTTAFYDATSKTTEAALHRSAATVTGGTVTGSFTVPAGWTGNSIRAVFVEADADTRRDPENAVSIGSPSVYAVG